MKVRLEHANLSVRDVEAMIRFLKTAFPEFRIRGEGTNRNGIRWVHVGTNDTYIVLNQAKTESARHWIPYSGEPGVNHLAYEVDDVESLRVRLSAAGYRDSTMSCPIRSAHLTRLTSRSTRTPHRAALRADRPLPVSRTLRRASWTPGLWISTYCSQAFGTRRRRVMCSTL